MDAEEPRDLRVEFQHSASCKTSIYAFMRNRELGLRKFERIKLLTPVNRYGRAHFEKVGNQEAVMSTKSAHLKFLHCGAWLGFTFSGNMLLGFSTKPGYLVGLLFFNSWKRLRLVKAFDMRGVHPTTLSSILPTQREFMREDTERIGRDLTAVPGILHLFSTTSNVEIEYTFPFACIRRINKITKEILPKQFMYSVSHGVLLNNGFNLTCLLLLPAEFDPLPKCSNRKAGYISQHLYSGSKCYLKKVEVNEGETINIKCQTRMGSNAGSLVHYTPITYDDQQLAVPGKWTHCFYLQTFNMQTIFLNLLERHIRTKCIFPGAVLHGLIDYEISVIGIDEDIVELQAEVIGEVLVNGRTDFYMFAIYLEWQTMSGSFHGVVLDTKITTMRDVFSQSWYPWNELPQMEPNTANSYYLDNAFMKRCSRKGRILEAGFNSGFYYVLNDEDNDSPETFALLHSMPLSEKGTTIPKLVDRFGQPLSELGTEESEEEVGYDYDEDFYSD